MQPEVCTYGFWSWAVLAAAVSAGAVLGWIGAFRVMCYNSQVEFEAGYQAALEDARRGVSHVV